VTRLTASGLLNSTTLDVPDERALSVARICWQAGGAIAIELRHGDAVWTWQADRNRFWMAAMRLGGMA
jgi:hypothetical protein